MDISIYIRYTSIDRYTYDMYLLTRIDTFSVSRCGRRGEQMRLFRRIVINRHTSYVYLSMDSYRDAGGEANR